MKKILYDLFSAQSKKGQRAGGFEFVNVIFKNLAEKYSETVEIYVFYDFDIALDEWLEVLVNTKTAGRFDVKEVHEIVKITKKNKFDVFYSGLPYKYNFKFTFNNMKSIGTFHGLREYEIPADYYSYMYCDENNLKILSAIKRQIKYIPIVYENYLKRKRVSEREKYRLFVKQFDKLFCDSYHSKYAFRALYAGEYNDLDVFYCPMKYFNPESTVADKKYILICMCDRFRKNAYRALKAIDNLQNKGLLQDYKTIVSGKASVLLKKEFSENRRIKFIDRYVTTAEMEKLYAQCSIFVFPSLNEGFGSPPLEAMKYGKTCVIAADTSMPELYKDAVYYVNPYDIFEMEARILQAIENPLDYDFVMDRYKRMYKIQCENLDNICEYIINEGVL